MVALVDVCKDPNIVTVRDFLKKASTYDPKTNPRFADELGGLFGLGGPQKVELRLKTGAKGALMGGDDAPFVEGAIFVGGGKIPFRVAFDSQGKTTGVELGGVKLPLEASRQIVPQIARSGVEPLSPVQAERYIFVREGDRIGLVQHSVFPDGSGAGFNHRATQVLSLRVTDRGGCQVEPVTSPARGVPSIEFHMRDRDRGKTIRVGDISFIVPAHNAPQLKPVNPNAKSGEFKIIREK